MAQKQYFLIIDTETTIEDHVETMPDGKFRKEQLQLINGIYPDGKLTPGALYKAVE